MLLTQEATALGNCLGKKKMNSLAFASNSNHPANASNIPNHEMPSFHHATLGYWLPRTVSKVATDFF